MALQTVLEGNKTPTKKLSKFDISMNGLDYHSIPKSDWSS